MGTVTQLTCTSQVSALFDVDEEVVLGALVENIAQPFAEAFRLSQVVGATQSDGTMIWVATVGEFRQGSAPIAINQISGNTNELSVVVRGTSDDAVVALKEVWKTLSVLANRPVRDLEAISTLVYVTTLTVELPLSFERIFPAAQVLRKSVLSRLGDQLVRNPDAVQPRFSIELPLTYGKRDVPRKLTFEPRVTGKPGLHVFWTQSPLRSEEHVKLIEELLAQTK